MERIRFVDFACNEIAKGNFVYASTACDYLEDGRVEKGQSADAIKEQGFDKDSFILIIEWRLFRSNLVSLSRRGGGGYYQWRKLDLSKQDKAKLYAAWQTAAWIQIKRNDAAEAERARKKEEAHWWP